MASSAPSHVYRSPQKQRKCTGRSKDDQEVLNDRWMSYPTSAEDSYTVTSRKNLFEEALYKCEDEHYELDMIIEANLATIRVVCVRVRVRVRGFDIFIEAGVYECVRARV